MGKREAGYITYRQDFIFPDDETFHAFSNAVLEHWQKVLEFQERKFADRGIECLRNDAPVHFHVEADDDDE